MTQKKRLSKELPSCNLNTVLLKLVQIMVVQENTSAIPFMILAVIEAARSVDTEQKKKGILNLVLNYAFFI